MDISTGIFSAPCSGVFEFMFQGIDVSVFLFFFSLNNLFFYQLGQT
jgi:hypothetical protein